ncbi:MAG: beta-L-arabinofuranosidase domain-containing protein [Eubacteriales bacterium]
MRKYQSFTPAELKPAGWLRRQLEIQAQGLSGNLDKMWPDIRDSKWIGGNCDGWERVPYWLDGFVPLAYLLDDEDMIGRAKKYIDGIVAGQCEDGWLCPCTVEERANYDMWALFLIDKVLMLYYDCSGDERIPRVVYNSLKNLAEHIKTCPLMGWGQARWFECLIPIIALYEIYPEEWLIELGRELKRQGTDYEKIIENPRYRVPINQWLWDTHVVNMGMALKEGGLYSLFEDGEGDDSFSEELLEYLFKYHGNAVGHFTGDECLSGLSPIQGTELCGVVEAMYSYEVLFGITGRTEWADRLETLAFNALPATVTPDMWGHQYCQQTNQISAVRMKKPIYRTNSGESGVYGLEPNFGCCTANFNQGFPKFALSTFVKGENEIAVCAIAPSVVTTELGGKKVTVESDTLYPFTGVVNYIVTAEDECEFTLTLRIPSSAHSAKVDGEEVTPGETVSLSRKWSGKSVVTLEMEFKAEYELRPTGMYSLRRGPLVYALKIGEEKTMLEYERNGVERKFPYCDWEYRPTTEWQYAFAGGEIRVHEENRVGEYIFEPEDAPVWLEVPVYKIDWGYEDGYGNTARHEPRSITPIDEHTKTVKFIPYGSTNIRLTELPFADIR